MIWQKLQNQHFQVAPVPTVSAGHACRHGVPIRADNPQRGSEKLVQTDEAREILAKAGPIGFDMKRFPPPPGPCEADNGQIFGGGSRRARHFRYFLTFFIIKNEFLHFLSI